MSEQLSKIVSRVLDGEIRIPGFQRGFVWEPERAALLMDSIYKGYPIGSVLLWRSRNQLRTEKSLGGYDLPQPKTEYPIDYVLDGQQRVTSIFATFQTALPPHAEDPDVWLPIYYDFDAEPDIQDPQFVALATADVDSARHFPLTTFFDPVAFATAYRDLPEERLKRIVEVQSKFVGTLIPIETFTSEDRTNVAIVFERVNRMGVELDVFQLLTAWTWSEDFDLQAKFSDLASEFDSFGFGDVGGDDDLMLRCTAAILRSDPDPSALVNVNGNEVREQFDRVAGALRLSIDFLRTNLHVRHVRFLPYSALLVPLAAFFSERQGESITDTQRSTLLRWFWRTAFSHRYSGNPYRNVKNDVIEAVKLRATGVSDLDAVEVSVAASFFTTRAFSARTVATKTFILALATQSPRSFISGQRIDLDGVLSEPNRKEYHHCFPRAYLVRNGIESNQISSLVNMAFLSRAENREISDLAPSAYRSKLPFDAHLIQESQLLPDSLFSDDWEKFRSQRAEELATLAAELCVIAR